MRDCAARAASNFKMRVSSDSVSVCAESCDVTMTGSEDIGSDVMMAAGSVMFDGIRRRDGEKEIFSTKSVRYIDNFELDAQDS